MSRRSPYLAWAVEGPYTRPRWWRRRRRTVPRAPLLARACRALGALVGVSALALVLAACEIRCTCVTHERQTLDAGAPASLMPMLGAELVRR